MSQQRLEVPAGLKTRLTMLDTTRREVYKNIKKIRMLHEQLKKEKAKSDDNSKKEVFWSRLRTLYSDTITLSEKEETLSNDCALDIGRALEEFDEPGARARKQESDSALEAGIFPNDLEVVFFSEETWFLGRVEKYVAKTKSYTVRDADTENKKISCPAKDVIPLTGPELPKGTRVLALYPNTTAMYPGEVVSLRKKGGKYMIAFDDDDEFGRPSKKHVEQKYVVKAPAGH